MALAVETQIRNALIADAGVAAIVGTNWWPDQLPQNPVFPAGTIQRVSDVPYYTQQSPGGTQASVGWCRISITVWCDTKDGGLTRENLCRAIILAMQTFSCYDLPSSPLVVQQAPNILLNRRHGVEPQTRQPLFKAMLDWRIAYQFQ